jgi:hypothetical protein
MGNIYENLVVEGGQTLHIIPDSGQVVARDLKAGVCYLQITSVDPVLDDRDLDIRKERKSPRSARVIPQVFDRFLFDTPFTKNGRNQGGLEDQWKRRTVLQTEGPFPALVNRLLVVRSDSREFAPIENAIGMIETRTAALAGELEEHDRLDGDQAPRLQSLQRILQGSVAVQVLFIECETMLFLFLVFRLIFSTVCTVCLFYCPFSPCCSILASAKTYSFRCNVGRTQLWMAGTCIHQV